MRENKGITLLALVVTIIVMLILAGISIGEGTNLLKSAKVENLMTNMITIKAKSKVMAEEVNAQVWNLGVTEKQEEKNKIYTQEYKMEVITSLTEEQQSGLDSNIGSSYEVYKVTQYALNEIGLKEIENPEEYAVVYNSADYTMLDIVYLPGIEYEGTMYYTLSGLQQKFGNQ